MNEPISQPQEIVPADNPSTVAQIAAFLKLLQDQGFVGKSLLRAMRYTYNEHAGEDIFWEAASEVLKRLTLAKVTPGKEIALLYRIMKTRAIDHWRRNKRENKVSLDDAHLELEEKSEEASAIELELFQRRREELQNYASSRTGAVEKTHLHLIIKAVEDPDLERKRSLRELAGEMGLNPNSFSTTMTKLKKHLTKKRKGQNPP